MTAEGVAGAPAAGRGRRVRVWVPLVLVGAYWAFVGVTRLIEMPAFTRFLSQSGVLAVVLLAFVAWWGFNRRVPLRERLLSLGIAATSVVLGTLASDRSLGPIPVFNGVPIVLTAWAVWLLLARDAPTRPRLAGLAVVAVASMGVFALLRMEGLTGQGGSDLRWRWSPTAEERYLSERTAGTSTPTTRAATLTLSDGDWPGFRGPQRDGVVRGVTIDIDWAKSPPRQVWRRRIGPGWSSAAMVDGRLFTQEQRGEREAVICLDAQSGSEIWSHEEEGRFWDALSSVGPRATPTFADGRVYAQGAAGTLVCLDAAGGAKVWSRNTLADSGGKLPDWGISSSPLVTSGVVVTFAAGQGGKGLLAYRADSGEVAWTVDAGVYSYSSPHLARIGGREQVLFIGDKGLLALDPASGKRLWEYAAPGREPRSLQPLLVSETQILVPLGLEAPADLVDLTRSGDAYVANKRWTSRNLKPSFNDCVLHDGHLYGFDGSIFTCVELATGNRKWKKGRYGTGQVVLLAEQGLLLVLSDQGRVVLLRPNPSALEELAEFQAIEGKTWNHPVVAHGRLYVRNAQEMACYELAR